MYKNRDKDVFQRDIEEKFSVRRSTVTNILQLMEKNGVIKREPVKHDARLKKIVLTQKGIDAHLTLEQELKETEKILLSGLSADEINQFLHTIDKMKMNLCKERSCDCL